jgi:hypothetical protein
MKLYMFRTVPLSITRSRCGRATWRCTSTPAQVVKVSSLWCDSQIPTAHRKSPTFDKLRGHESRPHCHDKVLRYAVTLQVCTHPNTYFRLTRHSQRLHRWRYPSEGIRMYILSLSRSLEYIVSSNKKLSKVTQMALTFRKPRYVHTFTDKKLSALHRCR